MDDKTHAEGDQGPIYRAFETGNLADLIMLDTRRMAVTKVLSMLLICRYAARHLRCRHPAKHKRLTMRPRSGYQQMVRRFRLPFDFSSGTAQAVLDGATIKDLDERLCLQIGVITGSRKVQS